MEKLKHQNLIYVNPSPQSYLFVKLIKKIRIRLQKVYLKQNKIESIIYKFRSKHEEKPTYIKKGQVCNNRMT